MQDGFFAVDHIVCSVKESTELHLQAEEVVRVFQVDMFGAITFDIIGDAERISNRFYISSKSSWTILAFSSDVAVGSYYYQLQ